MRHPWEQSVLPWEWARHAWVKEMPPWMWAVLP